MFGFDCGFWHHYLTQSSLVAPLGPLAGVLSLRICLSTLAALRKSSFCAGNNLIVSIQIFKYPLYAMHLDSRVLCC